MVSIKTMLKRLFIFMCLLLVPAVNGCGGGSSSNTETRLPDTLTRQVDQIIADEMTAKNLPGVVVGIWIPGQGNYTVAKGNANLTTGASRDLTSPFRIASITKTFTATSILILADQGKLSVSDTLAKWYPNFPNANKITVDHLLRMRSGIADSADLAFLAEYFNNTTTTLSAEDMIARSATRASEFIEPDQKTVYTNVNFTLLERIVEKVSGQSLGDFIRDHILNPLSMKNSLYPTDNNLPGPVHGYSADASGTVLDKTIVNPSPAGGAGAMISTLSDLRLYARALVNGTFLKPATQQARLQGQNIDGDPAFVKYGQGIVQLGKFYGHNGTIFGFSSEMWYLPEKDAVIVVNVNRLDIDDQSKSADIFFKVAKVLFPNDVEW